MISLKKLAPDLQPIIKAFREANIDLESLTLDEIRAEHKRSSVTNGVKIDLPLVKDFQCEVSKQDTITLRYYQPNPPLSKNQTILSPVIFFIHGGGWTIGDIESYDPVCRYLAAKSKLPVISVDYRLSPEYKFPIPLEDTITAYAYLIAHYKTLNIDPKKIIIVGDSAGANLATILAHQHNGENDGSIIAEALIYPSVDFTQEYPSHAEFTEGLPLTAEVSRWFGRQYLTGDEERSDPSLSPLYAPLPIKRSTHLFLQ